MTTNYCHKNGAARMLCLWIRDGGRGSADGNTFTFSDPDDDVIAVWEAGGPRHLSLYVPDPHGVLKPRRGVLADLGALLGRCRPELRQPDLPQPDLPSGPGGRIKALEEALEAARAVCKARAARAEAQRMMVDALRRQAVADAALNACR
jgi:hypothetical protein